MQLKLNIKIFFFNCDAGKKNIHAQTIKRKIDKKKPEIRFTVIKLITQYKKNIYIFRTYVTHTQKISNEIHGIYTI